MKKLIYLFIIIFIVSPNVNAQVPESKPAGKIPMLGGHKFLSNAYQRSSFVSTSIQADLGVGSTSTLTIPGIVIGDYEILGFKGKLLFFDLDVNYQQRFTPWLSLFVSLKMAGRLGTDMSTIMADGVNTLSGGEIGWLIRVMHTDKFNLAGTVSVSNVNGNFINVAGYFEELISNEPYPSVVKNIHSMFGVIGARGAYAFNPSFGLQLGANYAYGESFERGSSQGYFMGGFLGDLDFNPRRNVPIGLALGYTLSSAPSIVMADGGVSNLFLGKIGYTGSDDFELGLQFTYYNVDIISVEKKPFVKKVMLNLKFYF